MGCETVNKENRRATPRLVGYPHYKACSRVMLEHIWSDSEWKWINRLARKVT